MNCPKDTVAEATNKALKSGDKERGRYANMAIGSAYELDYHLQLALALGYLNEAQHTPLLTTLKLVR